MIDFGLNDMRPTYCKLRRDTEDFQCTMTHYPQEGYWEWNVKGKTREYWHVNAYSTPIYGSAEKAFENMKEYINGLQS